MTQEHRCERCKRVTPTDNLHLWKELSHSARLLDEGIMLCNRCYRDKLIVDVIKKTTSRIEAKENTIDNICSEAVMEINNLHCRFK